MHGRYEAAERNYKPALEIREKALGPNNPNVATVLENLAALYEQTNRPKEAVDRVKRSQKIRSGGK